VYGGNPDSTGGDDVYVEPKGFYDPESSRFHALSKYYKMDLFCARVLYAIYQVFEKEKKSENYHKLAWCFLGASDSSFLIKGDDKKDTNCARRALECVDLASKELDKIHANSNEKPGVKIYRLWLNSAASKSVFDKKTPSSLSDSESLIWTKRLDPDKAKNPAELVEEQLRAEYEIHQILGIGYGYKVEIEHAGFPKETLTKMSAFWASRERLLEVISENISDQEKENLMDKKFSIGKWLNLAGVKKHEIKNFISDFVSDQREKGNVFDDSQTGFLSGKTEMSYRELILDLELLYIFSFLEKKTGLKEKITRFLPFLEEMENLGILSFS
jgi:hypothetical protein